jgi:hypothetical protein
LQQFGEALEAGGRPKLALCTAPQHGKSLAAEDFAAWISGRNPNFKTIYASYSEDLGTRMSLNLQRLFRSRRYHDIFPHIEIDEPGWVANTNLTEFAYFRGSFRSTTINGPITGWGWTWHSRVDHALHIVPICLDQLAVEPLAHEWRQRTIVALRLEGVVPAIVRTRHARLELDAEQIHDGEHVIAHAAAVGVVGQDVDGAVMFTSPSRTWMASPNVPVMTFTWNGA